MLCFLYGLNLAWNDVNFNWQFVIKLHLVGSCIQVKFLYFVGDFFQKNKGKPMLLTTLTSKRNKYYVLDDE